MPQLTLFDSGEKLLVGDERGKIIYIPEFIAAERGWADPAIQSR